MKHYGHFYIDGQWVEPLAAQPFTLVNPATEAPFATVSLGGTADVDRAVKAARRAFGTFSRTTKAERIELLQQIERCFKTRQADVADAITQELGSPIGLTQLTTGAIDIFGQAARTLQAYDFEARQGGHVVRREAIGVCGLITAWNWPAQLIATKLSSALAAGCSVVVKPSEFTPVTAILMAEILHEAGVPAGVFNLINGDGPGVGQAICEHLDIDMVSFTGSTRAGVLIAQNAAPTVKRVAQELGGKSANVVLPDADLKAAADFNISRAFFNSGQSCHAPTRMLVQADQVAQMLPLLREAAARLRVGDPRDPATTMGPLVNKAQYERVQRYIEIGLQEGARLVCGGPGRPQDLDKGYFAQPTVFADVAPTMTIAQDEIFGPVLAVMGYQTTDEAIAIANGTPYGLGAYVFAGTEQSGLDVARELRAGRVFINGAVSNQSAPMGGFKRSGNGREMGVFGLEEYLEVKAMFGVADGLELGDAA
jgi:aldehyde dehydrogenase (NAD+)